MAKHKAYRQPTTTRSALPHVETQGDKKILMCPFCVPSHPIRHDAVSMCGTILQVQAVQTVIRAKYEKDMVCVRCGNGGGEMVRYQNAYIHTYDCAPGKLVFTEPPPFSKFAERVSKLPGLIRKPIEKRLGEAQPVKEVTPSGEQTGNILGWIFWKEQPNGQT